MQFLEKHSIKLQLATLFSLLLFAITTTATFTKDREAIRSDIASNKKQIEMQMTAFDEKVKEIKGEISNLKNDVGDQRDIIHQHELTYTEIRTKLTGLETILIEIKQKIK